MKRAIKKVIKKMANILPLKNDILLESMPDLTDNTKAVYDEMMRRGVNKTCRLIWIIHRKREKKMPPFENVLYIRENSLRALYHSVTAKCLICCNAFLPSRRKGQISFYLSHGTGMKSTKAYYNLPQGIDYCLVAAKSIIPMVSYELNIEERKMLPLGFPRNDALCSTKRNLHTLFSAASFEKIIVWYPTYRQHKNGSIVTKSEALPIIHDIEMAIRLNEYAKQKGVLVVLKPHFAQDLNYIKGLQLSNILFIDDLFFEKHHISSYEFVGNCDALITDYSSIYFDFTLCNKPIALIWEDVEEYKETPGFALGVEEYLKGAEKIYTLEELELFIQRVADEQDVLKQEREKIRDLVNCSTDGKNAERVVSYILEKSNF